eukprot:722372-Amphidinium_carterae.2
MNRPQAGRGTPSWTLAPDHPDVFLYDCLVTQLLISRFEVLGAAAGSQRKNTDACQSVEKRSQGKIATHETCKHGMH